MKSHIIRALRNRYHSEIESIKTDIAIFINNPQSIPEHTDYMSALDSKIIELSSVRDKLEALNSLEDKWKRF